MISAHSGGAERARPGSLAAYQAVVSSGAEYAEFDVRQARDGSLLAQHSDGSGRSRRWRPGRLWRCWRPAACAATRPQGQRVRAGGGRARPVLVRPGRLRGHDGRSGVGGGDRSGVSCGAGGAVGGFGPASITRDLRRLRWPLSFRQAAVQASGASWVAMSYRYARPEVLDHLRGRGPADHGLDRQRRPATGPAPERPTGGCGRDRPTGARGRAPGPVGRPDLIQLGLAESWPDLTWASPQPGAWRPTR